MAAAANVILETDRLFLREYVEADAEAFFQLNTDPEVLRHHWRCAFARRRTRTRRVAGAPYRRLCEIWFRPLGLHPEGRRRTSRICRPQIHRRTRRSGNRLPVGVRALGFGFATEAAQAVVSYGFDSLALQSIIGLVMPDNIASVRVLQKIGLQFSGKVSYRGLQVDRYIITR